jgi:hydrogenase maturation protein HypF
VRREDSGWILLHEPIIEGVVEDLISATSQGRISAKFHHTLVRMLTEICLTIRKERDLHSVALSGGVFQNAYLLENLTRSLEGAGFKVYTHSEVPCNDGGISLGQAVVASAMYKKQKAERRT